LALHRGDRDGAGAAESALSDADLGTHKLAVHGGEGGHLGSVLG